MLFQCACGFFKSQFQKRKKHFRNYGNDPKREAGEALVVPRTAQYTVTLNNPKATHLNSKLAMT